MPVTTTAPAAGAEETTTTLMAFPPERQELEHGGVTWAVVLAGARDADDPTIASAEEAAEAAGYTASWTDCDEGAADALGLPGGTITMSVYFDSEEDARGAADAFEARGQSGEVAEVRTMCLD